jgi:elongation factor Ts
MMDCKSALNESGGDMEAAVDWLRTKGLAKAAKKADRVTAEGLVAIATGDTTGAVVEVNAETDFVARNEQFQEMVSGIANQALHSGGDTEELAAATFPGSDKTIADYITGMIGTIGENMTLRRVARLSVSSGVVASYMHNAIAPGLGKIGVLVALESDGDAAKLNEIGKQVAMHVAATNPLAITQEDLDPAIVERERNILIDQARQSGKPESIIEKMVEGRMRKYYEEVALLSQTFVIDGESTVEEALKAAESEAGAPIRVAAFERFALGEGIETAEDDFAAEVAAAAGS